MAHEVLATGPSTYTQTVEAWQVPAKHAEWDAVAKWAGLRIFLHKEPWSGEVTHWMTLGDTLVRSFDWIVRDAATGRIWVEQAHQFPTPSWAGTPNDGAGQ